MLQIYSVSRGKAGRVSSTTYRSQSSLSVGASPANLPPRDHEAEPARRRAVAEMEIRQAESARALVHLGADRGALPVVDG
jgi:hypothetical protein